MAFLDRGLGFRGVGRDDNHGQICPHKLGVWAERPLGAVQHPYVRVVEVEALLAGEDVEPVVRDSAPDFEVWGLGSGIWGFGV